LKDERPILPKDVEGLDALLLLVGVGAFFPEFLAGLLGARAEVDAVVVSARASEVVGCVMAETGAGGGRDPLGGAFRGPLGITDDEGARAQLGSVERRVSDFVSEQPSAGGRSWRERALGKADMASHAVRLRTKFPRDRSRFDVRVNANVAEVDVELPLHERT